MWEKGISLIRACYQTDSRQHRVWGCNFFTDLRAKYKKAFQWLQKQPVWVSELALLPAQRDFLQQRIQWMTQFPQFHIPSEDHTAEYIFTDGTAFNGEQWDLCIAAGGFCVFQENSLNPTETVTDLVPGYDHSSFRAESWAVLMVLQKYHAAKIMCECSAVLKLFQKLWVMRPKNLPKGLDKHCDLWDQILQHIHGRNNYAIEIFKVKAHQNWRSIENPKQQWIGCANECVDIALKAHVKTKYASQLAISTQILQEIKANFEALHDFQIFTCTLQNQQIVFFKNEVSRGSREYVERSMEYLQKISLMNL